MDSPVQLSRAEGGIECIFLQSKTKLVRLNFKKYGTDFSSGMTIKQTPGKTCYKLVSQILSFSIKEVNLNFYLFSFS